MTLCANRAKHTTFLLFHIIDVKFDPCIIYDLVGKKSTEEDLSYRASETSVKPNLEYY